MRNFKAVLAASLLFTMVAIPANAAGVVYNFSTTLSLVSGGDTDGLDGAMVSFTATFDDGTVYASDFGFVAVTASSHEWTISGSTGVDGSYQNSAGAEWYPNFSGWFDDNGLFFQFGNFTEVSIWHLPASVSIGDLVSPDDFLGLSDNSSWSTADGSTYNWFDNASYTATPVPLPAAVWLMLSGLAGLVGMKRLSI